MISSTTSRLPKEVFKVLPSGIDYTLIPSDHGKRLLVTGVMKVYIPNGLGDGFNATVTKTDGATQMFETTGTMVLKANSLDSLETIDTSAIISIEGLNARVEGRLT